MGTKKEVNSGSVGLSKRMSQHVLFLGSARGRRGREQPFNSLLSMNSWPAWNSLRSCESLVILAAHACEPHGTVGNVGSP